ncbi:hypothetical protein, partial [Mitsuokella sp.]|uniref:hypothetical protein n=1 Tax=Mitsuokella sp. TaxID=2049034 RepID=UPI003D7E049C
MHGNLQLALQLVRRGIAPDVLDEHRGTIQHGDFCIQREALRELLNPFAPVLKLWCEKMHTENGIDPRHRVGHPVNAAGHLAKMYS